MQRQHRPRIPTALRNDHWVYYARRIFEDVNLPGADNYKPASLAPGERPPNWQTAFHGTWFYGLWNLLLTGQISPSNDESKGHEFNRLGALVYCSPLFDTGLWYARAQNIFGDGVYNRCVLELAVDLEKRARAKADGGVQWTLPSEAVVICGVWVCFNCGNPKGYPHVREWEPMDECIPFGQSQVRSS